MRRRQSGALAAARAAACNRRRVGASAGPASTGEPGYPDDWPAAGRAGSASAGARRWARCAACHASPPFSCRTVTRRARPPPCRRAPSASCGSCKGRAASIGEQVDYRPCPRRPRTRPVTWGGGGQRRGLQSGAHKHKCLQVIECQRRDRL